jgi:hypothetical protein
MTGTYSIFRADATAIPLADQSVDLTVTSPPYCDARTYGINAQRGCVEWVEWMLRVVAECQRVTRGPVIIVAAGVTRDRNYWPACEGLMWEWWKRGGDCQLYRPVFWHRVGIPGSGGKDWFRADVEYCMCFKRPGALVWSENTACGHKPKWAPGGEMSHRLSGGERRNQWGMRGNGTTRKPDGTMQKMSQPSHQIHTKHDENGQGYSVPAIANPGNLIRTINGGGNLGSELAHDNEAPYPVALVEFFVKSLCQPGGTVYDPFAGSGTTGQAAIWNGRNAILSDLRQSQCELTRRRLKNPMMKRHKKLDKGAKVETLFGTEEAA